MKGTKFETGVVNYIRSLGHFAEKLRQSGKNDEGDIVAIIAGNTFVLECKAHKSLNLPEFWRQAVVEAENYAKARGLEVVPPAYVIAKRRQASISDAWVITSLEKWIEQMPVPEGHITTSKIWTGEEEIPLPEEPTEVEQKEEERDPDDLQ